MDFSYYVIQIYSFFSVHHFRLILNCGPNFWESTGPLNNKYQHKNNIFLLCVT